MHWGHFATEDFVHWTVLPVALVPDQDYEALCGCCSGSAIEKDGKLYLLYTAAQPELQRQCLAVSEDDGITFVKAENNPILTAAMLDDEVSELDFRDPHLFRKDGWYYFIAGARVLSEEEVAALRAARAAEKAAAPQTGAGPVNPSAWYAEKPLRSPSAWHKDEPLRSPSAGDVSGAESERAGYGNLILCRSRDLYRWEYVGHLIHRQPEYDEAYYELNGVYECPDYLELDGREVLLSSPQNLPRMGNRYQNVHSGLYMLGKLDFETGRFRIDKIGEADSGFDFYAAQTLRMPDGRAILIAWKEMWDRNYPTQAEGWAGTYTFPRELRVEGDQLLQRPVRELDAFCKNRVSCPALTVRDGEASPEGVRGSVIRLRFTLEPGTAKRAGVKVFAGRAHETVISYDREAGIVEIDRSRSGLPFRGREDDADRRRCEVGSREALELELLLDVSTLELFLDGGRHVMTANVYPDPGDQGVVFFAEGGAAAFRDIEKYDVIV
jgi:beta-fructofuranosidase